MIAEWFKEIGGYIFPIGVVDIIDILLIAFLVYKLLMFFRGSNSMRVLRGIVLLLIILWFSGLVGLNGVNFIISKTINLGLLALVVLFQPEIRRALERVGAGRLDKLLSRSDTSAEEMSRVIDQTVEACADLSWSRYGALIVFERDNGLDDCIRTGTVVDAELSAELLKNIFFPKAALHDGAAIVRRGRIAAAGCMLPLTNSSTLSKELGMRHRAGIGMSENSDSVVIIVSEERGSISVAVGGMLKTNLSRDTLDKLLRSYFIVEEEKKNPMNFFRGKKNEDKKDI